MKNKRHKHADIIHAWAEGAEVEWWHSVGKCWNVIVSASGIFSEYGEYRIKPEQPKPLITEEQRKALRVLYPQYNWLAMDGDGQAYIYSSKPDRVEFSLRLSNGISLKVPLDGYAPDWRESLVDLTKEIEE